MLNDEGQGLSVRASGSWLGWVARLVGVVGLVAGPVALVSGATAGAVPNDSFTTVGAASWTAPGGVSCATFDVYGAQGGTGGTFGSQVGGVGGLGGELSAYVPVLAGTVYDLNVGARGTDGGIGVGGAGGAVGGGPGGGGEGAGGGGGGGMSSVSVSGTPLIIAAGGGGGGAAYDGSHLGGAGGVDEAAGTDGGVGDGQATAGGGATSSAGGTAGANYLGVTAPTAGVATTGGTGGTGGDGGGGGGGGLYGGGGGGAGDASGGAGGGGGSNLLPPGPVSVNHGVDAGNGGNGKVLVSYTVGDTECLAAPLTVKKATTGVTPTAGEQFTMHVSCPGGNIDGRAVGAPGGLSSVDLAFTADGSGVVQPSSGHTIGFRGPGTCTVTETVNGGATDTSYACSGSGASLQAGAASGWDGVGAATAANPDDPCATSGPQSTPMTVDVVSPGQQATVTVTNTLVAPAPAPAQVVQPRFTG